MSRNLASQMRAFASIRRQFPVALAVVFVVIACRGPASGPPRVTLNNGTVEVTNLPSSAVDALSGLSVEQWPTVFRVAVSADAPPMLGAYSLDGSVARFTPAFPLDAGRQYQVRFDASSVLRDSTNAPLVATIGRPAEHTVPTTTVARIYPTASAVPENVLRMYVEFSGPMGRKSGIEYIKLLDHEGKEIPGAVLPLDYEFWSPDHRRFTIFFDPGRVKDGILPNREMGRAFIPGKTVTLAISREWPDEHGLPLKEDHRRTFEVLPARTEPLDPTQWRIAPPPSSGRDPLVVSFPTPLDQSLLTRALGVRRDGQVIEGTTEIATGETQWRFTPTRPWTSGTYQFLALDILEDVAGNQVGRAFEVDNFETVDKDPDPKSVLVPFEIR
jgi:hypothetical protein